MAKNLSDQQKLFLELLFGEANGNYVEAKRGAGYSDTYPTSALVSVLRDEIVEHTKLYLARNGAKAAIRLVDVLDNPIGLGTDKIIIAAKDILDRIGVVKTEKVEVSSNGVFILPAKNRDEDAP